MQYVIPALLAFAFAYILWLIQRKRIQLDYEIIMSEPFPRESGEGQYFIVRLRNSGNTVVEKTNLKILFSTGIIESQTYSNSELIQNISESGSEIKGLIPLLNPKEYFSTTITVQGSGHISSPEVTARAIGTTATLRNDTTILPDIQNILMAISLVVAISVTFSTYSSYRASKVTKSISSIENLGEISESIKESNKGVQETLIQQKDLLEKSRNKIEEEYKEREKKWKLEKQEREQKWKLEEQERDQGKPKAEQLVFAIFNRSGLSHRFPDLIGSAEGVAFWKTGLFLLTSFLVDEKNRDKYISAAEDLAEIKEMAPSSLGFNMYLLAKMEQFQGNKENTIKWLELCKKTTPLMYEHLMTQDPAYDLEQLRQYLLTKKKSKGLE